MNLIQHTGRPPTPWLLALLTVLAASGACLFIPLFGHLGYEFSLAAAAVIWLAMGIWAPSPAASRGFLAPLAILFASPLLVSAVGALWIRNCDPFTGLVFYLLMAGGGVLVHLGMLAVAHAIFPGKAWKVRLGYFIAGTLVIAHGLWRLYSHPPIFAFNAIFGWYPGAIYDESITVPASLYWYRLQTSGMAAALLTLAAAIQAWRSGERLGWSAALAGWLGVAVAAGVFANGVRLRISISRQDMINAMAFIETPHFVIHLSNTRTLKEDARLIAAEHEFRLSQLARWFAIEPPREKIRSFVFSSDDEKKRWMGAGLVQVARPWAREIYISYREFPVPTLAHELAHVLAAPDGSPPMGLPARWLGLIPNAAMLEGMAVAAAWDSHDLTIHEFAAAMIRLKLAPSIGELISPVGFWSEAGPRAYTLAGSFLRYLGDRYGVAKLRAAYRSGDLEGAYGRTLAELENEWKTFLNDIEIPPRAARLAEDRFGIPGIFARPCPHEVAWFQSCASRELEAGRFAAAGEYLHKAIRLAGPKAGLVTSQVELLARSGRIQNALTLAESQLRKAGEEKWTAAQRNRLRMLMARLALQSERWGDAAKSWLEVLREDIAEPDHRAAKLGLMALSDPARARFLIPHLTAAETDPRRGVWILQYAQSFPDDPLGPYLYGRWLYNQGDHRSAAEAFLRAVGRRFPGEAFERENLLRLVVSSFLAGELDICGAALQRLEDSPSRPGFRLLVNDWKERLAWARSHQNDDAGYPLGK